MIRIHSSHLRGTVEGLEGIADQQLEQIARETAEGCTISAAIRGNVTITHELTAV